MYSLPSFVDDVLTVTQGSRFFSRAPERRQGRRRVLDSINAQDPSSTNHVFARLTIERSTGVSPRTFRFAFQRQPPSTTSMKSLVCPSRWLLVLMALSLGCAASVLRAAATEICPPVGWQENLKTLLSPTAPVPTRPRRAGRADCQFHEWSWEAFVWATAPDANGVPPLPLAAHAERPAPAGSGCRQAGRAPVQARRRSVQGARMRATPRARRVRRGGRNVMVGANGYRSTPRSI